MNEVCALAAHAAMLWAVTLGGGIAVAQTKTPHPSNSTSRCAIVFPFAPSATNRVPERELFKLFAGKRAEQQREWDREAPMNRGLGPAGLTRPSMSRIDPESPRGPPFEYLYRYEWRNDGSLRLFCNWRFAKSETFGPCIGRPGGAQDAGTWRIANGGYCHDSTFLESRGEVCFSIHRQDGRYLAKLASGSGGCFEGEIVFQ